MGTLHKDVCTFMIIYLRILPKIEMFQRKFVEKIKTHILRAVTFFSRKSFFLWDNMEKIGRAGQTTDKMARALCMPDN